jgi:hypothetical protein
MAFLILMLALTAQAQNANPISRMVKVKRGQTLSLSLLTPIDSGHANLGDDVTLKLVRPLVADGATVLPADWILHGKVTKVKRAGKNCKNEEVAWKLDRIKTPGGDQLDVQMVYSYPFDPAILGDPLWVPLDTPLTKIGGAPRFIGLVAVSIPLSPLLIPMAIFATEPCEGKAGEEKSLPLGLQDIYAVSKSVRVKAIP